MPLSAVFRGTEVRSRPAVYFVVSFAVFLLDQYTKHLIRTGVELYRSIPVTSFFDIVHVHNTGSAFGMFRSLGNTFFILVSVAAIIVISLIMIRRAEDRLALSLILGGAAGNAADRIAFGYVTDFLDFYAGRHHWPAFNVADAALTIGMIMLLAASLRQRPVDSGT